MAPENEPYHLVYWVGFPGRGEYIRVVLEDAGVEYTDTAHQEPGSDEVKAYYSGRVDGSNLPAYAPPVLRHGNLTISQTPNILLYLGKQLGYVPDGEENMFRVNALAMTILDGLSNEVYAVHHPLAAMGDYADQKAEAKKVADLYAKQRLPRFLNYFERVLSSQASGEGPWLFGGRLTYADIILFHVC
jgi:glutathione S-transferase